MKKVLFSCIAIFVLVATSAFAEGTSYIATKDYVDSGLQAVYTRIQNKNTSTQNDVDELTLYVGAPTVGETAGSGLTKRIEDLETNLENVGSQVVYTGEGAILVTNDRQISIRGIDSATGTDNKMYVIKNNMAYPLAVDDDWSKSPVLLSDGE